MKSYDNDMMWRFVADHLHADPAMLMLQYGASDLDFDLPAAVNQIDCRRRTRSKLSRFIAHPAFYFPSRLAAEQASEQHVAQYHASIVPGGSRVADLTAGLGIDAMTISAVAASIDTYELEAEKSEALVHNCSVMSIHNLTVMPHGDSIDALRKSGKRYDVIFIDPARRDGNQKRTYGLSDCSPDVKTLLPELMAHCDKLIIKASPMLDLTQTERDLPGLSRLSAVSYKGECKEVLAIVERGYEGPCLKTAVLIDGEGIVSEYVPPIEKARPLPFPGSLAGLYLYEPDAAVQKLGTAANLTAAFADMMPCDKDTHVYVSPHYHSAFPGRILRVASDYAVNDRELKNLKGAKYNIVCRNFPLKPDDLKKRFKLKDGGTDFIYGLRVAGKPRIVIATPV